MKLPGINYNTPVQSLGRQDINAPIRIANAEANVLMKVGSAADKAIESIDANKIAIDASKFQATMSELNATMKARKSYTIDELDSLGIPYGKEYGPDKLTEVPAYVTSKRVYQVLSKKIYDASISTASKKGTAVISKMYGQMYKAGITPVIINSINEAQSARSVENEQAFDSVVASGNADAAAIISETALATGVWSHEKFLAKTKGMPDKIANGKYLNALNINGDSVILQSQLDAALSDPDLKPSSKNSIYRAYNSKITKIQKNEDADLKGQNDQASYESYVSLSTGILDKGQSMDWSEISTEAMNMRPADGKGLITLNRLMGEKGTVTDQKILSSMAVRIRAISLPVEGTTISQRRESLVNELISKTGVDPVTGDITGPSKISAKDFNTLFDSINKAQSFVYDNPEVKRKGDFIWRTLTGGSKDMMTSLFGTGPDTINAVQAESDMLEAARNSGPGFNPDEWWSVNGVKYLTQSIEDNEVSLQENRISKYIKRDSNSKGGIDMDATVKNIRSRVKAKTMTQIDADNAVKEIYKYQQKRANRADLMNTGGSK